MLEQLRNETTTPVNETQRPSNDVPITPRSTVKTLTDAGVVASDVIATPLDAPAGIVEETVTGESDDDAALRALLDDDSSVAPTEEQGETQPDAAPIDEAGMKAFADQFKAYVGVDLKEAMEVFTQTQTQLATLREQAQAAELQTALSSLKNSWGVNDAELNRRTEAVLAYSAKLKPEIRAQFDSVRGVQMLWEQLERRNANASSPTSKQAPVSGSGSLNGKTFRKSELQTMMQTKPGLYNSMQAEISRAFETGNVIDDL